MKVINHLLFYDNGAQVKFQRTPNHGGKKKSTRFIVLHYDGANNDTAGLSWMLSKKSGVSAEVWIGRDGKVLQLLELDLIAYHAGESSWKGVVGLNSHSIGIEMEGNGSKEYTQVQLNSAAEVCKALVVSYPTIEDVVGHSDIAPGRKVDPGKMFPMLSFRDEIFGGKVEVKHTTTDVNLRKGAGTNFESLGVIKKGVEVNVLSKGEVWSEVFICDSKQKGFIHNNYLK